jgi:hypothetical protein
VYEYLAQRAFTTDSIHKQRKMAGNNSDFVLLESMDGYSFVVSRSVACASGMLKSMLDEESESPLSSLSFEVN